MPILSENLDAFEKFLVYDISGKYVNYGMSMNQNYLSVILPKPGRYYVMRENSQEYKMIDYTSTQYTTGHLEKLTFDKHYKSQSFFLSDLDKY